MGRFYNNLKGGVAKYLSETLKHGYEEILCLQEEIQLLRHAAFQRVEAYTNAHELYKQLPDDPKAIMLLRNAEDEMFEGFKRITEVMKHVSKFNPATKDAEIRVVSDLLETIIDTMYSICGEENEGIAERFEVEIGRKLQIASNMGTNITADEAVITMDNTVPEIDENEQIYQSLLVEAI